MRLLKRLLLTLLLPVAPMAPAGDDLLKPFVLAHEARQTSIEREAQQVTQRLQAAGFEVLGSYAPFPDAVVVAVTNKTLREAAAPSLAGFAASVHVGVTRAGDGVQVAYLNPRYLAAVYRTQAPLDTVATQLAGVLGAKQAFGADGRHADVLRRYQYLFGMERLEDTYALASYPTQDKALQVIERNLARQVEGAARVYRVDLPGERTVFGISGATASDRRVNDRHILAEVVDAKAPLKTTAYLPYQLIVEKGIVRAPHLRFRLAVWHPDLTMATFGKLISSPSAVERWLKVVASDAP